MGKAFQIGGQRVGPGEPTYFIAEIGSNFDGSLEEALHLVDLAKQAGADAVKFQSFKADKIVSPQSFEEIQAEFQTEWDQGVYEVYEDAEFPREWHEDVAGYARKAGLDFFSSPYDRAAVDLLLELDVPAIKIGSGDIDWLEMLDYIGRQGKPVLIATGASTLAEVDRALRTLRQAGCEDLCVMQCITNYPSSFENANVRVLETYAEAFPDVLLGYSDHTPGDVVPLAAVALGARVIEKHFTPDRSREGPDHPHSMEPDEFEAMVDRTRKLEAALGSSVKTVTPEEETTRIVQRRSLHASGSIAMGEEVTEDHIEALRPATGIDLDKKEAVLGRKAGRDIEAKEPLNWEKLE